MESLVVVFVMVVGGDPLSPMLFVLVMECFSALIKLAEARGLFSPLRPSSIRQRVSLYADDVVVFISHVASDLTLIIEILALFYRATGLATNLSKSKAFPVQCSADQIGLISGTLGCQCSEFPCTYLGVPLSPWCLPKFAMQPVVLFATLEGQNVKQCGRLVLAQSTLCAILVHISMATKITSWAIQAIEKLVRRPQFLVVRLTGGRQREVCRYLGQCCLLEAVQEPWHSEPTAHGFCATTALVVVSPRGREQNLVRVLFSS
jgi:hypothetical protein